MPKQLFMKYNKSGQPRRWGKTIQMYNIDRTDNCAWYEIIGMGELLIGYSGWNYGDTAPVIIIELILTFIIIDKLCECKLL